MIPYRIRLANCVFHARHGAFSEEERLGQRFHVDVAVDVSPSRAPLNDDLADGVDYGRVFSVVESIVTGTRRDLIEALAHDVCCAVLKLDERIAACETVMRKPAVPIAGILDHAEVTVRVERS